LTLPDLPDDILEVIDVTHNDSGEEELPKYPPFPGVPNQPMGFDFTNLFPKWPKSHSKGWGTIIKLDPAILYDEEKLKKLKSGLQYTLSQKGHGQRPKAVPFFGLIKEDEGDSEEKGEGIPMLYSRRQCAGVKVCEFLAEEFRGPHTEVDPDGLKWAKMFASQSKVEAKSVGQKNEALYEEWFDYRCDKYTPSRTERNSKCNGKTVIYSRLPSDGESQIGRIYIGCENYTPSSTHGKHTFYPLRSMHDPAAIIKMWGKDRCRVKKEMLQALKINWDESEEGTLNEKETRKLTFQALVLKNVTLYLRIHRDLKTTSVPIFIMFLVNLEANVAKFNNVPAMSYFTFSFQRFRSTRKRARKWLRLHTLPFSVMENMLIPHHLRFEFLIMSNLNS
jgi:hypothetical protein